MKDEYQARVLLIDDDSRNLDVLESVLASPEIILARAQTAKDALLQLVESEFAAIVLDVHMPGIDGLELAGLVKERKRTQDIPIIILTAVYLEEEDVLRGYQAGAADYLTKPINPLILKSKINVFVDLYRKHVELTRLNEELESAQKALKLANDKLEIRVQERTAELVLANRTKDDFLAKLSHELRTPLGPALLLASDSAGDPAIPETLRRRFEEIARHVEIESRLIDDLLDLTAITNGKVHLKKEPVDIHLAIKDAMATVEVEVKKKRIFINLNLKAENFVILGDSVRVRQIFWNVIKNAVKFTPGQGQITIETHSNAGDGRLTVKVIDTGIGLTQREIDSIFNAFSQGEFGDSERHSFGGLGLGLTITRRLAELQSGTIRAESLGRDQGAIFAIEFPYMEPAKG